MDAEFPDYLTYHNRHHTEYVVRMADFLALKEGCSLADRRLIAFAALFHDAGFLIEPEKHEECSCAIATNDLEEEGLSPREIEKICGMIMATKIPQNPHNLSENIIADADLYYLGTDRYALYSNNLYSELKYFNPKLSNAEWVEIQKQFLTQHRYHTHFAYAYLEPVKLDHLKAL